MIKMFSLAIEQADGEAETEVIESVASDNSTAEASKLKHVNLNVTYFIKEKPDADLGGLIEFAPEEALTLDYDLYNGEEFAVNIVGVAGNVYTIPDGRYAANITERAVGPIPAVFDERINFQQEVRLVLPEGQYYVEPILIVQKEEEIMRVAVQPVMVDMIAPPMSFFDIRFLSVQVTIFALLGGIFYYYNNRKVAVQSKKPKAKPIKVDESWLPDNYKK